MEPKEEFGTWETSVEDTIIWVINRITPSAKISALSP
jgi:hypothetical protein